MSSQSKPLPPSQADGKQIAVAQPPQTKINPLVVKQMADDLWKVLVIFRCLNTLCVWTFFQPDEYYQSLEPAWQMAFGAESGAWITWEWENQLRSSLYPALFAGIYYVAENLMKLLSFFPQFRAMLLSAFPTVLQALFAGVGDYYTWQLSERVYGIDSYASWVTLFMSMFSPWQWYCSTRTLSNSLETTLTITALYYWPWELTTGTVLGLGSSSISPEEDGEEATPAKISEQGGVFQTSKSVNYLRISLALGIAACILRPTNGLIWLCILTPTFTRLFSPGAKVASSDYLILFREAILCGSAVLAISGVSDYLYFGELTFPPYQWVNFNLNQDLAVFYGRNDWHYYISQGLPLLLTTYLPFTLVALWNSASSSASNVSFIFTTIISVTLATLSLISHKEVRFIYPLLPLLHIITAPTVSSFFQTTTTTAQHPPPFPSTPKEETVTITRRKPLLTAILLANLGIAGYTGFFHQSGVIAVTRYLRQEYESLALDGRGRDLSSPDARKDDPFPKYTNYQDDEIFAAFLMPCHSTPWRSKLIYSGLNAWALTCDPPIHLAAGSPERAAYRDEADRFYDNPLKFLKEEVNTKERPWPRYIVGFEGIEAVLKEYYESQMKGFKVREKWRGFNTHWHDDPRRQGDVVVWEFVDGSLSSAS